MRKCPRASCLRICTPAALCSVCGGAHYFGGSRRQLVPLPVCLHAGTHSSPLLQVPIRPTVLPWLSCAMRASCTRCMHPARGWHFFYDLPEPPLDSCCTFSHVWQHMGGSVNRHHTRPRALVRPCDQHPYLHLMPREESTCTCPCMESSLARTPTSCSNA